MNRERTEALFAEVAVLVEKLETAVSEAKRVQNFNVDTQYLEKTLAESKAVEQRLRAAEQASFKAVNRAGWLSTRAIFGWAFIALFGASTVGAAAGYVSSYQYNSDRFAEQRKQEIARISTNLAQGGELLHHLNDIGVTFYRNGFIWSVDSDDIEVVTRSDPNDENKEVKLLSIDRYLNR
jgi:hypothetical protein